MNPWYDEQIAALIRDPKDNVPWEVEYSHNNSGGSWWLKDADWKALETAGWKVDWYAAQDQSESWSRVDADGRRLGALASRASLIVHAQTEYQAMTLGLDSWRDAVGQDPDERGCDCCGQPHYFYASKVEPEVRVESPARAIAYTSVTLDDWVMADEN
jgi:hypothetical protein